MGLISSIFGGGKTATQEIPAEPKRKNAKSRTKSNKPNKLSKPRTNTSANNLLDVPGGGISRQSSLASVNRRGQRRSSSVPARSDVDPAFTEDVGEDAGLGRGRQQERDKRASRLSSLFRSKSSTPASIVLQDRPDDKWILDDNGGVDSLDNSDPLRRYSQLGLAGYAQDLPTDSQISVTDSTPDLHRSPSYIRYQQARLSLVAETSSAVQINDTLRRQRLAETEALLTRNASIHSQNSNASNRYSMRSSTPALSARMSSTEQVHLQPENYSSHSARRRSHLTPGVATRMGETSQAPRASRLQKQNPKARRQSAAEPGPSQTVPHQFERSKTLPSEEEINSYYYDQTKRSESPVENLEMLAPPLQKPRFREDITDTQRMSTPTDLRHIGSFELGSLRITNGAAPSAANTPKARKRIAADHEVENVSARTTAMSLASLARRHPMEQVSVHEVKQPRQPEITVNPAEPSIDPPSRSASTATKQSAYSDVLAISRASSQRLETAPQIPGGASELAEFYRLDIDFLPSLFSADLSMPSTPKLEATSKRTSEEDELFEDARSDLQVFEDAKSVLDRRSPVSEPPRRQDDELYLPAVETMSERRPAQTMSSSTHARLETLAVTDSGYSSYTSLGSVESSRSQSKLRRDASESPTEFYEVVQPAEVAMSSKPRVPKADYWRTQHAPSDFARESRAEPIVPLPVREAPSGPPRYQMPRPPIPTTAAAHIDDAVESQPGDELAKSTSKSAPTSPNSKRPSLLQHRSTGNVLQKSSRLRPNSLTAQGRANSDDTITPVKKKWQRHSTQLSAETPITVQKIEEPEEAKVPPVPKRLSLTFKERASRFSMMKHSTPAVSDNVPPVEEKAAPPPAKERSRRFSGLRNAAPASDNVSPVEEKTVPSPSKERSSRFSESKHTTPASDYVSPVEEKPAPPPSKERSSRFSEFKHTAPASDNVSPVEEKPVPPRSKERSSRFSEFKHTPPASNSVSPVEERPVPSPVKERSSRFSELKHTPPASNNVSPVEEKPAPHLSKEEVQRSVRRQSSPAHMPGIRLVTAPAAPTVIAPSPTSTPTKHTTPSSSKSSKSRSPPKDTPRDPRADFERHITASTTVATSLGASSYDAGASAIAPTMPPTAAAAAPASTTTNRPRRDRTGRIIGMDEESASSFARARSQVRAQERAQEAERRELLVSRVAQSISESSESHIVAPVPNKSAFANQLAIASQRSVVSNAATGAAGDVLPPVPSLMVPEPTRQSPLMKGKREKIGPPPSLMNGRNRKHGILGFWSGSSASSSKDAQIDVVPKRTMPMGPVGSSGEIPAVVSAKSAGFTPPVSNKNLPSMAPHWRGPSPAELAEMALQARKEGRLSTEVGRRSMSAGGVYEKKGAGLVVGGSRPGSVMSEREAEGRQKGRRRGWSFRSRKEGE
ncbi:hypothetical protein VE03_02489 [Pseudogymnoascus sp. 23342-1-I1]|nr:hypothetical protein VE03_02489 [Pseudogymnoascus sp. 23342-1-I1]